MAVGYNIDEVFAMAEQIERNGALFYHEAARTAADPEARGLLARLAEWEEGHERIFSRMRASLSPEEALSPAFDPDGEAERYLRALADEHVFPPGRPVSEVIGGARTPSALIDLALRFERDSIRFLETMKQAVPARFGQGEVDRLVEEERSHARWLEEQRTRFTG